jgi:mersacidin/lichenicidin family type 2 lantibiotic
MSNIDIVRAWKDEDYRASLSEAEQAMLPENPAGLVDLADEDMSSMAGGAALACTTDPHTETCAKCCSAALASDVSLA